MTQQSIPWTALDVTLEIPATTPASGDVRAATANMGATTLVSDGRLQPAEKTSPLSEVELVAALQPTGWDFISASNSDSQAADSASSASNPSGNRAPTAEASLAVAADTGPATPSALAVPKAVAGGNSAIHSIPIILISPEQQDADTTMAIAELPTNGRLVLGDGATLVSVGQILSATEAVGLRFIPSPGAAPTSVQLGYIEANSDQSTIFRRVMLVLDMSMPTIALTAVQSPDASTSNPTASAKPAPALPSIPAALSAAMVLSPTPAKSVSTAALAQAPQQVPSKSTEAGITGLAAASGIGISPAAGAGGSQGSRQLAAVLPQRAIHTPDSPGSYNAVDGQALNLWVPSEEASPDTIQITGLPTNGTVTFSDGSTAVSAGEALTPAQAGGLRFKPDGATQESQLNYTMLAPGAPPNPLSEMLGPVAGTANSDTPTTTFFTSSASPATAGTAAVAATEPLAVQAAIINPNPIVLENEKPGTPQSVWEIAPGEDSTEIQGFTTSISTPLGGTVQFKIDNETGNGNYSIQIYRLGYYGGDGATLYATINHSGSPVVQPAPLTDAATGLVDAGNWSVTDSWTVPTDATSGVYVANVIDGSQIFQIPFVVTAPSSTSDIVFQTSDETWQAYNGWGGDNLYGGDGPSTGTPGAAYEVSYNRPIVTRDSIGTYAGPQDSPFGAEYAAIYWLEENGYDVSYISGIDTATDGALLLNHKVFMDAGHDEYWTDSQVANVEAAENAGVNLAFFSGNEVFWQTRLAPSIDTTADSNRTLVSYKDTHFNQEVDPSGTATGTFQDPRFGTPAIPSNELTGTLFQVDQNQYATQITIPYGETELRYWRNTSVAETAPGQTATLEAGLLGYEWDSSPDNGYMPAGLIDLSTTTASEPAAYNIDWGSVDTSGTATNNIVEYRDPTSGALVFGAGTVFWSWGLSNQHDNAPSPFSASTADPNVQQATVNLLADMGVQPQTLQASLVLATESTDHTPPTSVISSVSATDVVEGQTVTVAGTATDAGGGVIGGVEVSTDGGQTWHQASGTAGSVTMDWTYSFSAPAPGSYTIETRAVDDSLNVETPAPGVSYTVTPSAALSLFNASGTPTISTDNSAIEVGVRFTASTAGTITGIRFYKGALNTGTHIADLWTASGTLLATATFTNETASGWQQVNFSTPVTITAGTTYIASYHTNTGYYADTLYYFATYGGQTNGSLNAPGDSLNGVYAYGSGSTFPINTDTDTADNYWVDVVFDDSGRLPPVLSNVAATATYVVQGSATTLSAATTISDSVSTTLASASVAITGGFLAGDTLTAATAGTNITASYDAASGVLSLTGTDTLANYQQVLDSVRYASSLQDPTEFGADASRTISWSVNDGVVDSATQTTTVDITGGPATASLFSPTTTPGTITVSDPQAVDLGVKFQASTSGEIIGVRFYKGPQDTGTHIGDLWTSSGTLLASATFTDESASGWQQVNFATPVYITAGTTYIASYEAPAGEYAADASYFTNAVSNGPLTALSDATSGGNGVYAYGSSNPFPNNSYQASNYWVDVVFLPSAPLAFTTPASITGTAQEGSLLTAISGTTNDPGAVISAYQWQSSSDGGATWSDIAGATAATYTPIEADEGHVLRVIETASDNTTGQNVTSTSAGTPAVSDIPPAFTTAASITGSPTIGSLLSAVNGRLNDADAAVTGYQWQSSQDGGSTWSDIGGATGTTYTPVPTDTGSLLRVVETATDPDGGSAATSASAATTVVTDATLVFTTSPSITGTPQEGSVLTAVNGATGDANAAIAGYQWQSSSDGGITWTNIAGATAATYMAVEADETHLLRVVETAIDTSTWQSGTSASAATAAVADIPLAFTSAATISGSAVVGSALSAVNGGLSDADAAVTGYQWQSSADGGATWSDLSGATGATYTLAATDEGSLLRVVETATDADGGPSTTSISPATAAITAQPVSLFSPTATPGTVTVNDPAAVDLGVKFQASTSGQIIGIRFYKGPQNTGTHIGDLWTSTGVLLASATFTNETASGWQQVDFATPVNITAGTTYIASYEAPAGEYSGDDDYFTSAVTNGPLTAPSDAASGGNGVYAYGSGNPFPSSTYNGSNYWVDVVFTVNPPLSFAAAASIAGTAQEGAVLTAVNATPNDPNAVISAYQWQSSTDGGATWSDIAGATLATYTPTEADETHLLRVVETATDRGTQQTGISTSAATAAVADIALAFTSAASISGSPTVGSQLSALTGTLNDADAAVTGYQWQSSADSGASWTDISGATGMTYTPVASDAGSLLRVVETATDADGGSGATSASPGTIAVTNDTLVFTASASVSGSAQEGSVLTALDGVTSDTNAAISAYQWQSSSDGGSTWSDITGATAATYTPAEADETHLLRVVETAIDTSTWQSGTSASAATAAVADIPLAFTSAPSISGTPAVGSPLSAGNGGLNNADAAITGYQWQASSDAGATWSDLSGATGDTYTPVASDQGNLLRVVETATDDDGGPSVTSTSAATAIVSAQLVSLFAPSATPGTVTVNDSQAVDLGVKFQASTSGQVIGVRFYKGPQNSGTHVGDLWTSTGVLLASATFTNETASGWQQVDFATPVTVTAGTTYIASYEAPAGEYAADVNYFTSAVTNGPLTAPSDTASGGNGVYAYGSGNPFPNNSYSASNYWVDVVFAPSVPPIFTSPATVTGTAQEGSPLIAVDGITNDPNAVISSYQWQSSPDNGATWSDIAGATAATYTPAEADEGQVLRVVETASDSSTGQNATTTSAATAAVGDAALAFTAGAAISGSVAVGSPLSAVAGTLNDADASVTGYQWQSSTDSGATWSDIGGAIGASYTPVAGDAGSLLRVVETATDADGGPSVNSTSTPTGAVAAGAPTGFAFAPATSSLQALQGGGASLSAGTPVGTFTQTGGVAGDSFAYTLSGSTAFSITNANAGTVSTGASAVAANTEAALSLQVSDLTNGSTSTPLPFETEVGSSAADTIDLQTLGITGSTPALLYGLDGNDTLNAASLTGPTWLVGGAGADTLTGGAGPNTYLYAAASESTPAAFDVIENFNPALDTIDLTGIGTTPLAFQQSQVSTSIAAQSIGWQQSGGNTFVYVNTSTASSPLGSASMEIELRNSLALTSANFLHS